MNSRNKFTQAMLRDSGSEPGSFYLVTSHRHLRRYGLGRVPHSPGRISPFLRNGYLVRGKSPAELAGALGLDQDSLVETVGRYDEFATRGSDPEFGKGSTAYQRAAGDPGVSPNPCIAPPGGGPFYAIRILPSDIGTMIGVAVNEKSQALDAQHRPIPELYAVGTAASALTAGTYPGAGANLGPATTSGYVAAKTINNEARTSSPALSSAGCKSGTTDREAH